MAQFRRALALIEQAMHDWWTLLRAFALARRGRHTEAAALARDVMGRNPTDAIKTLRCSRIYALCSSVAATGKSGPTHAIVDHEARQRHINAALDALRQTLRVSPEKALDAFLEPDFDSLRPRGVLQSVLPGLSRLAVPKAGSR